MIVPLRHGRSAHAGIRTDEHTRALDQHNKPIAGLYAAGNDEHHGGRAGITPGLALTFGYIAGKHIAAGFSR
jgi:predicted oxidoreductase